MRKFQAIFITALKSLLANKTRSILTMLGIIIGIAAVIALLSLGEGAQGQILEQVNTLGTNTVTIVPVANFRGPQTQAAIRQLSVNKLDRRIVDRIEDPINFPEVALISPEINDSFAISSKDENSFATLYGVTPAFFQLRELSLEAGNFFGQGDVQRASKVAILGFKLAENLFGDTNAVGKEVRIEGGSYRVVAVLTEQGGNADNQVFLPLSTAQINLVGSRDYSQISIKVKEANQLDTVALKLEAELRRFYRIGEGKDDNFTVYTSADLATLVSTITGIFTSLLASIAGISLVVGGIGIMNIMLVSVTERTKEIGLRKAIGAKQSDILGQFLIEAIMLTLIGGLGGIAIGFVLALIMGAVADIEVSMSLPAVLLATSVSMSIGVVFGFYPAYRAARLNPIEALRYE